MNSERFPTVSWRSEIAGVYDVESSIDLMHWRVEQSAILGNAGLIQFIDPLGETNVSAKFYRLVEGRSRRRILAASSNPRSPLTAGIFDSDFNALLAVTSYDEERFGSRFVKAPRAIGIAVRGGSVELNFDSEGFPKEIAISSGTILYLDARSTNLMVSTNRMRNGARPQGPSDYQFLHTKDFYDKTQITSGDGVFGPLGQTIADWMDENFAIANNLIEDVIDVGAANGSIPLASLDMLIEARDSLRDTVEAIHDAVDISQELISGVEDFLNEGWFSQIGESAKLQQGRLSQDLRTAIRSDRETPRFWSGHVTWYRGADVSEEAWKEMMNILNGIGIPVSPSPETVEVVLGLSGFTVWWNRIPLTAGETPAIIEARLKSMYGAAPWILSGPHFWR